MEFGEQLYGVTSRFHEMTNEIIYHEQYVGVLLNHLTVDFEDYLDLFCKSLMPKDDYLVFDLDAVSHDELRTFEVLINGTVGQRREPNESLKGFIERLDDATDSLLDDHYDLVNSGFFDAMTGDVVDLETLCLSLFRSHSEPLVMNVLDELGRSVPDRSEAKGLLFDTLEMVHRLFIETVNELVYYIYAKLHLELHLDDHSVKYFGSRDKLSLLLKQVKVNFDMREVYAVFEKN